MDKQEREQLTHFLQQLVDARLGAKDAEADTLIQAALGRQADAGYLLVQRALSLEQALQTSQANITRLQAELDQARPQRGFLSDSNTWGQAPASVTAAPAMQAAPPGQAPVQAAWGGSFLGSVATTAAGVVAGSLLFRGLDTLMGHHGSPAVAAAAPAAALAQAPAEAIAVSDAQDNGNDLDSLSLDNDNGWG